MYAVLIGAMRSTCLRWRNVNELRTLHVHRRSRKTGRVWQVITVLKGRPQEVQKRHPWMTPLIAITVYRKGSGWKGEFDMLFPVIARTLNDA